MNEFEVGQQVAVSDMSTEEALRDLKKDSEKFYYLHTMSDGSVIVRAVKPDGSDYASLFAYVAEMPEGGIK